jgi:hypothetical protein
MKFALGVFGAVVGTLAAGTTIDGEGTVTVIGTVVFDDNLTIESGSTLVLAGNAIVQDSRATAGNLERRETTPTMLKWQDTTPTMPKQSATRVVVVDVDVQRGQQPTPTSSPTSASPIIEPASFPWAMTYSPTPTPLASTGSHNTDIVLHRGRLTDSFFYSAAVASQRSFGTATVVDSSTTSIPVSLSQDAAELEGEVQAPRVRHGLRARVNVNIVHNGDSSFATHFSSYSSPRLREK